MAAYYLSDLILHDLWPGAVNPNLGVPANGWDSTKDNFKTTSAKEAPSYPLGTKIMAYTDNTCCPGWYTMMYAMYHSYESGALYDCSGDFSDGQIWCTHNDASTAQDFRTDTTTSPWYVLTKCITKAAGDVSYAAAVAIPCASLASDGTGVYVAGYGDSYGWFWVGGVCPCADATIIRGLANSLKGACVTGEFATKARGPVMLEWSAAISTVMLTCDYTSTTDVSMISTGPTPVVLGWLCATAE